MANDEVDESSIYSDKLCHWQQVKQNCEVIATFGSSWRWKGINHLQPQRKNISAFSALHVKQTTQSLRRVLPPRRDVLAGSDGETVWRYVKWERLQATVSLLVISQPVPEAKAANHSLTSISSGIADKNTAQLWWFKGRISYGLIKKKTGQTMHRMQLLLDSKLKRSP